MKNSYNTPTINLGTLKLWSRRFLKANSVILSAATLGILSGLNNEVWATDDCAQVNIRCVGAGREYTSLVTAIQSVQSGDTVVLDPGEFDYNLSATFVSKNNVSIIGAGTDLSKIKFFSTGISISSSQNIQMSDLTIQGLSSQGTGASITSSTGVTLDRVNILGANAAMQITGSDRVTLNGLGLATNSQGIFVTSSANISILSSAFEFNSVPSQFSRCLAIDNVTGGISGPVIVQDSIFSGCGYGVAHHGGLLSFTNSLIENARTIGMSVGDMNDAPGASSFVLYNNIIRNNNAGVYVAPGRVNILQAKCNTFQNNHYYNTSGFTQDPCGTRTKPPVVVVSDAP